MPVFAVLVQGTKATCFCPYFFNFIAMTFRELYEKMAPLSGGGIRELVAEAINSHSNTYIELIQDQLLMGRDGAGLMLDAYRSERYAQFKLTLNPAGVTDLRLRRDFYRGMGLSIIGSDLIVNSSDEKNEPLKAKYGENIMVMSEESIELFKQKALRQEIKDRLEYILR